MTAPRLSVAIPIYNEEAVLPELLGRLTVVLDAMPGGPHEVVFVDDGSRDASRRILREAAANDRRIRVVELSRNFGHQAAITAALDHAAGDMVAVMDGDLQDPPERLPELVAKLSEGFDVVYARRVGRKEGLLLRAAYRIAYRLIAALSDVVIPLDTGDFAVLSRRVVDHLRGLPEKKRYLRGLRAWVGFAQASVDVERDPRFAGAPKYTPARLVGLALDGMFSFSVLPLRVAALVGLLAMAISGAYALYALTVRLLGAPVPPGFTALIGAVTFLAGVQLLFIGVVGEYVGRIYEEIKRRPHYLVERVTPEAGSAASGSERLEAGGRTGGA